MATLKDIQTQIAAVKKTRQITKAMNMVATSRLRGAQMRMEAFRPYAVKFADVLGSLAEKAGEATSPLLVPREEVKNIHVVLCTSDRGLCGGFNGNLIEKAASFLKEKTEQKIASTFTNFGKKGRNWCRKENIKIESEYLGVVGGQVEFNIASKAARKFIDDFLAGVSDEVYIVFSEFISIGRQVPVIQQLLPIPHLEATDTEEVEDEATAVYMAEHICEPSANELLEDMLPRNIYVQVYKALLETSTSEHAARMSAMDNATKACNDIVESLSLTFNKARQAAITAELMDIVGGAEALKG